MVLVLLNKMQGLGFCFFKHWVSVHQVWKMCFLCALCAALSCVLLIDHSELFVLLLLDRSAQFSTWELHKMIHAGAVCTLPSCCDHLLAGHQLLQVVLLP